MHVRSRGAELSVVMLVQHLHRKLRGCTLSVSPQSLSSIESRKQRSTRRFRREGTPRKSAMAPARPEGSYRDRRAEQSWDLGARKVRLSSGSFVVRSECSATSRRTSCAMLFFPACTRCGTSFVQKGWTLLAGEINTSAQNRVRRCVCTCTPAAYTRNVNQIYCTSFIPGRSCRTSWWWHGIRMLDGVLRSMYFLGVEIHTDTALLRNLPSSGLSAFADPVYLTSGSKAIFAAAIPKSLSSRSARFLGWAASSKCAVGGQE